VRGVLVRRIAGLRRAHKPDLGRRVSQETGKILTEGEVQEMIDVAERFLAASGSDCGIAYINTGTSGAEMGSEVGGEKDTSGGREAGLDTWKAYMRLQATTINWGAALPFAQGVRFELAG